MEQFFFLQGSDQYLLTTRTSLFTGLIKVPLWRKSHLSYWSHWRHKQVTCLRIKMLFTISFCSKDIKVFKICKLGKWWCHILNQVLIKYDEKRYIRQFLSEMFDSLQQDSTKGALHIELNNFINNLKLIKRKYLYKYIQMRHSNNNNNSSNIEKK